MGSDAPGLDGAREEPQPPSHPLAANHGRQESKTREAGVIVSFGGRPAGAAPAPMAGQNTRNPKPEPEKPEPEPEKPEPEKPEPQFGF